MVYPEGTSIRDAEGFGWNTGSGRYSTSGVDDVAFLTGLANVLVTKFCADPRRLLITGESNGGAMTLLAACDARTRGLFAFFAPVIPAIDQGTLDRCGTGPALALTVLASRLDKTIPYDGHYPAGQRPLLAQEDWFLSVAALRNGCQRTDPTRTPVADGQLITPAGCPAGMALTAIDDGVHTWPGGPEGTGGLPPGKFPATSYLWQQTGW